MNYAGLSQRAAKLAKKQYIERRRARTLQNRQAAVRSSRFGDERDEHLPMPVVLCPMIYSTCSCPLTGPCLPGCGSDFE